MTYTFSYKKNVTQCNLLLGWHHYMRNQHSRVRNSGGNFFVRKITELLKYLHNLYIFHDNIIP